MTNEYKLVIDNTILDEYSSYYFKRHPRARKKPIEHPYHPSINVWMVLPRIQMNDLKQKWKDFVVWWIKKLGYSNLMLDKVEMTSIVYMPTRRRADTDNTCPKAILDGFTEAGFWVDDDGKHLTSLTLKVDYDKDNPRTEFYIKVLDSDGNDKDNATDTITVEI